MSPSVPLVPTSLLKDDVKLRSLRSVVVHAASWFIKNLIELNPLRAMTQVIIINDIEIVITFYTVYLC